MQTGWGNWSSRCVCVCVCVCVRMDVTSEVKRAAMEQEKKREMAGREGAEWVGLLLFLHPPFQPFICPLAGKASDFIFYFFTNMWNTFNHLSCAHPSCLHPAFSHSFPPILNALAFYAYYFTAFAVLHSCLIKKQYIIVFALCKALINQKKGHWGSCFFLFFFQNSQFKYFVTLFKMVQSVR